MAGTETTKRARTGKEEESREINERESDERTDRASGAWKRALREGGGEGGERHERDFTLELVGASKRNVYASVELFARDVAVRIDD